MALYKEASQYSDVFVLAGLSAASLGLLIGASAYFWSTRVELNFALAYVTLGLLLAFCVYRLAEARYRLKITDKAIKIKLEGTRTIRKEIPLTDVVQVEPIRNQGALRYRGANLAGFEQFYSLKGYIGLFVTTRDGNEYFIGCKEPDRVAEMLRTAAGLSAPTPA